MDLEHNGPDVAPVEPMLWNPHDEEEEADELDDDDKDEDSSGDENHQEDEDDEDEDNDDDSEDGNIGEENNAEDPGPGDDHPIARPQRPLGPFDAGRMELTTQEHQWALQIKEAIEGSPDLKSFSDFWYGQLAIIERENVEGALERAYKIQHFQETYDIMDTVAHGQFCKQEYMNLFPGFYLSMSFSPPEGTYVLVEDVTKFYASALTPQYIPIWLGSFYYLSHALNPDFEAIRRGSIAMVECNNFHWKKNHDSKLLGWMFEEIAGYYPHTFHKIRIFNTGMFYNIVLSMVRPFLPKKMKETIEIGCICEFGTLDQAYLTPSLEAANRRLMERFTIALQKRYANEAYFTL